MMRKLFTFLLLFAVGLTGRLSAQTYEVVKTITVNHNELEKTAYSGNTASFDIGEVKTALGVEDLSTCQGYIVNCTSGEFVLNSTDGWRDANGDAAGWGTSAGVCVKIQDIPMGSYTLGTTDAGIVNYIGCFDGSHSAGEVYHAKWGIVSPANQAVIIDVVINFVAPPTVDREIVDLGISTSVTYTTTTASYVEKTVSITDEQVAAICQELGVSTLGDAVVYGYNPTSRTLLTNYASYDGWRDANGDFANHSGNSSVPACVKYTDGKNYTCFSIAGCPVQTVKCYWAIANDTKAVLVEVDFAYEVPTLAPLDQLNIADLGIATSVTYETSTASYTAKTVSITDAQVAAICQELGVSSLSETVSLGYNPSTGTLIDNAAGFDGWRAANGDFHTWSGNSEVPACVKYTNGKDYECFNIAGCPAQTVKCYWALAYDTKAVLVEVDFIYEGAKVTYADTQTTLPAVAGRDAVVTLTGRKFFAGWNTLVLPFAVTKALMAEVLGDENVELATMQEAAAEAVRFAAVDEVPANTPCLLYVSGDVNTDLTFDGVDVTAVEAAPTTAGTAFNFVGSYVETTVAAGNYLLGAGDTFKKAVGGNRLGAFRAFLVPVGEGMVKEAVRFTLGGTTAIRRIDGTDLQDGAWYSLAGQRVSKPLQKGIYVKEGKKVVMK